MNSFPDWALNHKLELGGTLFGLVYVWFSIRQSLFTWPTGIATSLLYCLVFFNAGLYAMMGLQFYYLIISGYGWWSWKHGVNNRSGPAELKVTRTSGPLWLGIFVSSVILYLFVYSLLNKFTGSPILIGESLTTSLSIVATWMLARKKIEHWIIWIFIDLVSAGLYLQQGLYPTVFLFVGYALMAVIGLYEWNKKPQETPC
jgi:nicotinamide mononucleotide transporter